MASAKSEPIPQPKQQIVLTLSEEEAEFIQSFTGRVFGNSISTYRGLSDEIRRALAVAGVSGVKNFFAAGSYIMAKDR